MTKKAIKKTVKKTVTKSPVKITMTVNQAKTLQKALGTKSYAFLNKKLSEATNV